MQYIEQQKLVSDLDRKLGLLLKARLSYRASRLFKFVWRSELAEKQTDVTAAIAFLKTSRRPAYNAIFELEKRGLVYRVTDEALKRRKLLRVTREGWEILASMTEAYSDIVTDHVRRLDENKTNWVDLVDTEQISPDNYASPIRSLCSWSAKRNAEPLPADLLNRIFILSYENTKPESFQVSYWGRGMKLRGGRDFAGQNLADLKTCSSLEYWQNSAGEVLGTLDKNEIGVSEIKLKFAGHESRVQRAVIPDQLNGQVIVGTWFVDARKSKINQ